MKQIKMCVICKYEIVEKLDRYVRLTDYEKGYKTGEVYYHLSCWKERFQITNSERKKEMIRQTMKSFRNIGNALNKKSAKEYIVS